MAIADHNVRFQVTLHEDFVKVLKAEAKQHGVHGSQLAAFILEEHFSQRQLYRPNPTDWKDKLKISINQD